MHRGGYQDIITALGEDEADITGSFNRRKAV